MKILHVNKFFDFHGGAEVYLHRLMKAQQKAGDDVHVFSTQSEKNAPSKDAKYFVRRFNLAAHEGWLKDLRKAMIFLWNTEAKRQFSRMLDEVKPDVIHLHNIYHHLSSSILAPIRQRKIPCVMTLHDYKLANPNYSMFDRFGICEHAKNGRYWELVKHRCLGPDFFSNALAAFEMSMTKRSQSYERTVKLFLCPSRFMKEKMEEWGEPLSQLAYVPNPVELSAEPVPRGGGYVLYAGRLSPEKGLLGMIEAAARVPELTVKIAGRGPQEPLIRERLKKLKAKNIELIGFQSPEALTEIRRHAEAVVLPTVSYENASTLLLEAMADGIPCLATDIGGNPELVEDDVNGLLVKPGDVDVWEEAFRRFLALPEDVRQQMGGEGRKKIAANYLWSTHLERLQECYADASTLIQA